MDVNEIGGEQRIEGGDVGGEDGREKFLFAGVDGGLRGGGRREGVDGGKGEGGGAA